MNIKEAFRYQKFLSNMMDKAAFSIGMRDHAYTVVKKHLRSKVDADDADVEEVIEPNTAYKNDDVIAFMTQLLEEKSKLSKAIADAKASMDLDLDAEVDINKLRRNFAYAVRRMLQFSNEQKVERGTGYKFNVEGNQVPFVYDIEVDYQEAFDRSKAKKVMKEAVSDADSASEAVDAAMVNTHVDYEPLFDVNDTFEDAMDCFLSTTE